MTTSQQFIGLGRHEVSRIARDPKETRQRRLAARAFLGADSRATLGHARRVFEDLTPKFEDLSARLGRPVQAHIEQPAAGDVSQPEPVPPVAEAEPQKPAIPIPAVIEPASEPEERRDPSGPVVKSRRFEDLSEDYLASWDHAEIDRDLLSSIDAFRVRLVKSVGRYQAIQSKTGVPWYFIGAVHGLESSFDFGTHLHNGDPLSGRTSRVPRGRPVLGVPPFTWDFSAEDALRGHGLHRVSVWSLDRTLFELERYNGFGYRMRGVQSPYLWSGSSRYEKGKYVRDGVYDPNAVSKQIGAATLMKRMEETGDIARLSL